MHTFKDMWRNIAKNVKYKIIENSECEENYTSALTKNMNLSFDQNI